jgi:hypothetical protein
MTRDSGLRLSHCRRTFRSSFSTWHVSMTSFKIRLHLLASATRAYIWPGLLFKSFFLKMRALNEPPILSGFSRIVAVS